MQEERTSSRGRRYTKPVLDGLLSDDEDEGVIRRPSKVTLPGQAPIKRGRPSQKCRMVDITNLLGMPQRQAAELLGISESMLCKRYRYAECTKRKWPFRYLGKLDKKIAAKKALLARTGSLSPADRLVLDALLREKESILTPIQIRVTEPQEGQSSGGRKPKKAARTSDEDEEMDEEEDEDEEDEEDADERTKLAPPMMQKVRRQAVFEDDQAMNDIGLSFNPASILLTLSGGV